MNESLTVYFDYKSPYTYVGKNLVYDLEKEFDLKVEWRPYNLSIPDAFGAAETNERGEVITDERSAHQWRRVKYMYVDCRRLAKQRGLPFRPPLKVFGSNTAHIGMLYAERAGARRPYNDTVFELFWKRELDIDDAAAIAGVLEKLGVDAKAFPEYLRGEGRIAHEKLMTEAHERGVFGVPTFIFGHGGDMYWGSENLPVIRERLAAGETAKAS